MLQNYSKNVISTNSPDKGTPTNAGDKRTFTTNERKIEHALALMEKKDERPKQGIFFDGQIFDAYLFVSDLIRSAKNRIVLIDNYVDDSVLAMLDKRPEGVSALIYTPGIRRQLQVDLERHNAQYPPIEIRRYGLAHDRFLIASPRVECLRRQSGESEFRILSYKRLRMFVFIKTFVYLCKSNNKTIELLHTAYCAYSGVRYCTK